MDLYALVLLAHSYTRWFVLILGLVVIIQSYFAYHAGRDWQPIDERIHGAFVGMFNLQFILGVVLYIGLSPTSHAFFDNMGEGMGDSTLRFYGIEHLVAMVVATALVHMGKARAKRAADGTAHHKAIWMTTLFAFLIVLASIPWPFLPYGRPLFRGFGL